MINVLKFSMLHEYKFAWNISARTCFTLFKNMERCMVLYRYKIATGFEVPFIWQKFGTSNPSKIKFEKLNGDSLIIFHLDVFKTETYVLKDLLDWCLEKNIDIYIPVCDFENKKIRENEETSHLFEISDILKEYDYKEYDLVNIKYNSSLEIDSAIYDSLKPLLRDIKIKNLLS